MEPSSSPKLPYNPASDGFAAKAWECLRRNKAFWKDLHLHGATSEDDAVDLLHIFQTRMATHPFFAAISDPLMVWSEAWDGGDPEPAYYRARSLSIHMSWPEIHPDTRGYLENALCRYGAFPVEITDHSEFDPHYKDYSPVAAKKFLSSFVSNLDLHRAIYVPTTVWDRKHKEDILREVSELLGAPLAKDARWLKNRGRYLGTERLWRAYLLFESWLQRGCDRDLAMRLTAYLMYGTAAAKIALGNAVDPKAAQAFLQRFKLHHNHHSTVEKFIDGIERAIESVYPKFCPIAVNA